MTVSKLTAKKEVQKAIAQSRALLRRVLPEGTFGEREEAALAVSNEVVRSLLAEELQELAEGYGSELLVDGARARRCRRAWRSARRLRWRSMWPTLMRSTTCGCTRTSCECRIVYHLRVPRWSVWQAASQKPPSKTPPASKSGCVGESAYLTDHLGSASALTERP